MKFKELHIRQAMDVKLDIATGQVGGQFAGQHGGIASGDEYVASVFGLQEGEVGVFLETAHPAKFLETVEGIIGKQVEIPAKLQAFMKGTKQSVLMAKDFASFKEYLLKE